ncbi:hypothetical protein Mgra_00004341 [Meloidogyne graminicola]|uniref:Uncharacterized protein n=1 Tax=Meloidogyne graminicola TaxID=189291 RepID=A0A8S9ZS44_9BILA|nr:hypothetical protein Mgra_00004341 [Meloidogyne graminicola]
MNKKIIYYIYYLFSIIFLLLTQKTECQLNKNIHFIIKHALLECKIPEHCKQKINEALINERQVPICEGLDYFELLKCLDNEILPKTNVTILNSKTGQICCNIEEASLTCQVACKSALFAPTLSLVMKKNRIELFCYREHGNEYEGDKGLINCLETANKWLTK